MERPNTPGLGGYLVAWAVSVVTFALLLGLPGLVVPDGGPAGVAPAIILVTFFACFYSIPFAVVGMPLVHVACRQVESQWVHVLVAGAVGLLPLIVFGFLGDPFGLGAPWVPAATAIGRWSVVPLVRQRRALATA